MFEKPFRVAIEPTRTVLLRGRDVIAWLQTKLTCDTRKFALRGGGYGFATDINGRVLFDAHVRVVDGGALLVVPPGLVDAVCAHVEKYVIIEDVAVVSPDAVSARFVAGLGPADLGFDPLEAGAATFAGCRIRQGGGILEGTDGTWIVCASADAEAVDAELDARGIAPAADDVFDAASIRAGFPRVGRDILVGETIPVEAGAWHGIATNKGCYLGQEVIERLISRGNPNKRLMRLRWTGPAVRGGTPIRCGDEDAGVVTASVTEPDGTTLAMGYVRRRFLEAPADLEVEGNSVELLGLVETAPAPSR